MSVRAAHYYSVLIAPYVRSSARRVVGRYSPEEIYSSKREQIEREIRDELMQKLAGKHVDVDAILIREVQLPEAVQAAIQTKLEGEQKALEMQFVLERTKQEAVRKHIEAGGIADYQSIISKTLNDQVIEWKGIEATESGHDQMLGLITSYRIQQRRVYERRLPNTLRGYGNAATVGEIMTPWEELALVNYRSLRYLNVAEVYQMFQGSGLTHVMVVETHEDDSVAARGLISRAALANRLQESNCVHAD
jgi:SPFH domain / Band 7 family